MAIKALITMIMILMFSPLGYSQDATATSGAGTSSTMGYAGLAQAAAGMTGNSMIGAAVNIGFGGWMASTSCPSNMLECGWGVLMIAQGALQVGSASDTNNTTQELVNPFSCTGTCDPDDPSTWDSLDDQTTTLSGLCDVNPTICETLDDYADPGVDTNNLSSTDLQNIATNMQNEFSKNGITLDPNNESVTIDGVGTIPASALGDAEALAAAGFDKGKVDSKLAQFGAISSAIEKGLRERNGSKEGLSNIASTGFKSGGGGSRGGRGLAGIEEIEIDDRDPFADLMAKMKKKGNKAPVAAGLVRKLPNGESIGAKADNIFEMIHRRYRAKARQNIFLKPNQK